MRQLLTASVLLVLLFAWQPGPAAVPETMTYQGVLLDGGGVPVPDGNYNLTFRIYNVAVGGAALWTEAKAVPVQDGIFDTILGDVVPIALLFDVPYWLGTQVDADPELAPRTELASAPYAHRAKFADVGGPDADWAFSGNDIYRVDGSVGIGAIPTLAAKERAEGETRGLPRDRGANKVYVYAEDQAALWVEEHETFNDFDDLHGAIVGQRSSGLNNPGMSHDPSNVNFGVMGYNLWGDEYTFGVVGATWFDDVQTGGVLAYEEYNDLWAAMAYMDAGTEQWGFYTPGSAYVEGTLRLPTGAVNGHVLTSDVSGNASWQAPVGGGLTLPYSGSAISAGPTFMVTQNGNGTSGEFVRSLSWEDILKVRLDTYDQGLILSSGTSWASISGGTTNRDDIVIEHSTGQIGIGGVTSPGSRLDVEESTSGQALEVSSTYVGLAPRLVNFEKHSVPVGGNDILQLKVPIGSPDDFQFIECQFSDFDVRFAVDGDGHVTGRGGATVTSSDLTAGEFESDNASGFTSVVKGTYTGVGLFDADGIRGESVPADWYGIGGYFEGGYRAVEARVFPTGSNSYYGTYGYVSGGSGTNYGVYGIALGAGTNWAGYFAGDVNVVGTLTKGGGAFKIDHPLEPETKFLYHSFVESPDMMNVYNGNVVLDGSGEASVELPDWFEVLNRDFRYQLTCIGGFAPVYVAEKISGNRFRIAGGEAGLEVSWQVTGVRQDKFAEANRIPVEEDKPASQAGKYLHPGAFGLAESAGIDYDDGKRESARVEEEQIRELPKLSDAERAADSAGGVDTAAETSDGKRRPAEDNMRQE